MFEKIKEMLRSKDPEMKTLGEALKKEQELRDNLNLPLVKLLQEQNPNLIVCGSTAMYLQGVRLKRWSHSKSDLDIVIPFYFKYVSREWLVVGNDCIKKYGNDFDYTIQMDGITVDVRIDNKISACQVLWLELLMGRNKVLHFQQPIFHQRNSARILSLAIVSSQAF